MLPHAHPSNASLVIRATLQQDFHPFYETMHLLQDLQFHFASICIILLDISSNWQPLGGVGAPQRCWCPGGQLGLYEVEGGNMCVSDEFMGFPGGD